MPLIKHSKNRIIFPHVFCSRALFDNRDCWRSVHTSQDQLISAILALSRSWVKNSYTNAQLRAIAYTDKKRSASHLATAAKANTCMSLIKHSFFQESHHIPTRVLQQSAIERYHKANRSSRLANAAKVTAVSHVCVRQSLRGT